MNALEYSNLEDTQESISSFTELISEKVQIFFQRKSESYIATQNIFQIPSVFHARKLGVVRSQLIPYEAHAAGGAARAVPDRIITKRAFGARRVMLTRPPSRPAGRRRRFAPKTYSENFSLYSEKY